MGGGGNSADLPCLVDVTRCLQLAAAAAGGLSAQTESAGGIKGPSPKKATGVALRLVCSLCLSAGFLAALSHRPHVLLHKSLQEARWSCNLSIVSRVEDRRRSALDALRARNICLFTFSQRA